MTVYGTTATRDRQGFLFGLTGAQLVLVIGSGVPVWAAMTAGRWAALAVLVPLWIALGLLVCVPVRGYSAMQWVGVVLRHTIGAAFGWSDFQSAAAAGDVDLDLDLNDDDLDRGLASHGLLNDHSTSAARSIHADLPGILAGIEIHDGPPVSGQSSRPAIIQNHTTRTWAATARITHPGIGMSDETDRSRMGAGLTEMLEAATAGLQIDCIALQVRTVPDDGTERAAWVRNHARTHDDTVSTQVHTQLDEMTAGAAVRREAFLTVVTREETIGRDARRAGRGIAGRARIIYSLLAEVEARLTGAVGCTHVTWLDTAALSAAIRTGFEPGDSAALADAAQRHLETPSVAVGVPLAASGPTHATTAMRSYRHGDWESVSTTLLLPRKGARMGALARVLIPSQPGERRSMTVFFRPVPQRAADRATGRAQMSAQMAATIRTRIGRQERAIDRQTTGNLQQRDAKLQSGRSLVKVSCAVSITVPHSWNIQDYGRRLDSSVRLSGFVPLPLDGAHDTAFAVATIPLGVSLPRKRY